MEVVIPEWVLAFDVPLRTLMLRHEQEHRSAGDPLMLLVTTLIVALVPWNVALWWQSRRLRLAIEVDCDDRVLSTHPQQERYGLLLLALAQRKMNAPTQFAPTLVESTSHLERRIIAMRNRTLPISRLRALGVSVVAISTVALACAVEPPTANQTASLDERASGRTIGNVENDIRTAPIERGHRLTERSPASGAHAAAEGMLRDVGNDITVLNVDSIIRAAPIITETEVTEQRIRAVGRVR
jgi:hypothetical protein